MKVDQSHKVMEFDQKAFLAPYIAFNTEKRRMARSGFEKDFFKLMSNAVYGKTIERLQNRVNVKLVTDQIKSRNVFESRHANDSRSFHIDDKTKTTDEQSDICRNDYIRYSKNGCLPISLPLHGVEVFARSM